MNNQMMMKIAQSTSVVTIASTLSFDLDSTRYCEGGVQSPIRERH